MDATRTHPDRIAPHLLVPIAILLLGGCSHFITYPPPPTLHATRPVIDPVPPGGLTFKLTVAGPTEHSFLPWCFGDPNKEPSRIFVMDLDGNVLHCEYLTPTEAGPHPILRELERVRLEALADGLPKMTTDDLTIVPDTTDQGTRLPDRYIVISRVFIQGAEDPAICVVEGGA